MFQSSDHTSGSPSFTIKIAKRADGQFEATCPTQPQVAAGVGPTESVATNAFKHHLDDAVSSNKLNR